MEGTNWQRLLPDDHPGILEGKWCLNRFVPYACDVRALDAAGERAQRDAEELIGESEGARVRRLRALDRERRRKGAPAGASSSHVVDGPLTCAYPRNKRGTRGQREQARRDCVRWRHAAAERRQRGARLAMAERDGQTLGILFTTICGYMPGMSLCFSCSYLRSSSSRHSRYSGCGGGCSG